MKEVLIFIVIFLVVFIVALIIFNGRFIYAQIKYSVLGAPPVHLDSKGLFSGLPLSSEAELNLKLVIPAIGVEAPIVLVEHTDEYIIQKAFERGVVRYPNSNVILGHSSAYPWYRGDYGSVFSLLNKLEIGDNVFIFSGEEKYTYQVLEKQIELPKNINIEQGEDSSIIYLVSCWPISTSWKRVAIKAEILDKD